jgi:hypothetical protein
MEHYRFVSGIPGVGTILVLVGGVIGFGSMPTALLGLVVMLVDTRMVLSGSCSRPGRIRHSGMLDS